MDDDEIIELLRDAVGGAAGSDLRSVPTARVTGDAVAAGSWLDMDAELAEVVADTIGDPALAGVRAAGPEPRLMTYRLGDIRIECELTADALLGQVFPARELLLELVTPDGASRSVPLDGEGRFLVQPLPSGPTGLRCTPPGRPHTMTPWFLV